MINKKYNITEILVLIGVFILLFFSSDPVMYPDSNRYLAQSLHDPPLYSLMINTMQLIFGNLNSVIVFQTLLISFSIIYFSRTLTIHFNLDIPTKTIIVFFLFFPILQFYNHLLTEPICYAFSIFFVSFVIKLIYNLNIQNIIWSSIFVILLVLTRNQFLFLYPVVLLLYLGIFILYNSKKILTFLIISFLSIFIIHNLSISFNKYKKMDYFENKSVSNNNQGIFFFTYIDSIYVSSNKDIELFENQNLRNTVDKIFKEMENKKALIKYYDNRGHFSSSLKEIRYYSDTLLEDLAFKENTTIINLKKEISIKLITANYKTYIKHIFKKFYDSTWLFIFVPFFMMLASLVSFIKYKSKYSLLILFLSIFTLSNHSVIYLFGRVQPRYFIYTDFILLIFIFITFLFFFKKREIVFK